MMKSFRDPVTNVLKARGSVAANAPGDLARDEPDGFALEPGKWRLVGDAWQGYDVVSVPDRVLNAQARLQLIVAGKLAAVNAAVAAMPGAQGDAARVEWDYRPTIERHHPLVLALAPALGWTDADLDALFIAAATL
jgi:hypothetical protein